MAQNPYLESRVLTADPLELVRLLYQHGLESTRAARRHLAAGDIAARSKSVCGAIDAVAELDKSLDHSIGGEVSRNLAELYQYIRRRLTEGNLKQQDGPLAEAESLLATLYEAWKPRQAEAVKAPPAVFAAAPPAGHWQDASAGGAHIWSA